MAAPDPAAVEHRFNGDSRLLDATQQRCSKLRQALVNLQQELQQLEGHPVQITAEFHFNIGGPIAKEHTYSVSVTDSAFDSASFTQNKVHAGGVSGSGSAASLSSSNHGDQRPSTSRTIQGDDDIVEVRPFKKPRAGGDDRLETPSHSMPLADDATTSQRIDELHTFVKDWHDEWTRQGGWLFDSLNRASTVATGRHESFERKVDAVQDILGQSLNTASATTMAELSNIANLLPWLENCRKINADKVQAREEKWRSSSATFHDQSRRDREVAEKRIEDKLEAQRKLLIKVAEANGIDIDEVSDGRATREASLGAQLTAELNLEAARAAGNAKAAEVITVED